MLPSPEALKLLLQAIHVSLGPCRFEGTTFRSVALAIPIVRQAAEACAGGSLLTPRIRRDGSGRLQGQLTREAHWMFSTEAMHLWPRLLRGRGYVVRRYHSWVYWDRGEGLPPRIDHVTKVRLPPGRFPVDGWLLPDDARDQHRKPLGESLTPAGAPRLPDCPSVHEPTSAAVRMDSRSCPKPRPPAA